MTDDRKPPKSEPEPEPERFKKNLAALLGVPKSEIEALEARTHKKPRKARKKGG